MSGSPPGYAFSPPLTIAKIEHAEMAAFSHWQKIRPDLPKLPFGFMHAQWVVFKSTMRPGDEIVQFSSDAHSWQHLAGETGYAITRSGCLVKKFTTMVN